MWTIFNEKWSKILLTLDEIKMLILLQVLIFQINIFVIIWQKISKKKEKCFHLWVYCSCMFWFGGQKRNQILIKKNFFFEKFCAKNETKNGTKNELFGAVKTCFFCKISHTNYENWISCGTDLIKILKIFGGVTFFLVFKFQITKWSNKQIWNKQMGRNFIICV